MPTSPASPSERTAGRLASENGPDAREEGVEVGGGTLEVGEQRGLLVGQLAEPRHRRAELVEELGEPLQAGAQLVAAGRRDLGGVARLA